MVVNTVHVSIWSPFSNNKKTYEFDISFNNYIKLVVYADIVTDPNVYFRSLQLSYCLNKLLI